MSIEDKLKQAGLRGDQIVSREVDATSLTPKRATPTPPPVAKREAVEEIIGEPTPPIPDGPVANKEAVKEAVADAAANVADAVADVPGAEVVAAEVEPVEAEAVVVEVAVPVEAVEAMPADDEQPAA